MSLHIGNYPVRQLAYAVPDVRQAALDYVRLFGAGPFFMVENIAIPTRHHGRERVWTATGAFGQFGDQMIELMQLDDQPMLQDVFPKQSGGPGLHHVAIIVEMADQVIGDLGKAGLPVILEAQFGTICSRMVDTRRVNGHLVEIYENSEQLIRMYEFVRREAEGFDGREPVRPFPL